MGIVVSRIGRGAANIVVRLAVVAAALWVVPVGLSAQSHEHADAPASTSDARLQLLLGGPHLILYHRGYLALSEAQVLALQPLRRAVCEAEAVYVERTSQARDRLSALLADSAPLPRPQSPARPAPVQDALSAIANAESDWLTVLMRTRRDALALLTSAQRTQASALRDHWLRESLAMIDEATRPGQRGHPGTQLPIRVPGMVVATTTLLPYCEALHGPSMHLSVPPPR